MYQKSRRTLFAALALGAPIFLVSAAANAATYYVAPNGTAAGTGTQASPFQSFARAQTAAAPGDTVYFRGGTYAYTAGTTTCTSGTATINAIALNKSGTSATARISYMAYPGETPIFDFSGIKDSCRVTGIRVTGSWIYLKGLEIKGVPQNNNLNHESWGVWNSGSNNTFELLDMHHNMGPGLFIQDGGNNLVLNCDSHENYDPMTSNGAGQSADGFGCHIGAGGKGNVFRGCRSWWNSDDGWDFIQAAEVVIVENSWSWYNGYLPDTMTAVPAGNGNGFKGGGFGVPETNVPASPPSHIVRNCVSFLNKTAGFYANHEPVGDHWYNNTAYGNHPDFNLLGMLADGTVLNVGTLRNNIAFGGTLLSNNTGASVDDAFNSWDTSVGVTVSNADFQSTSIVGMDGPRQADGSLPCVPFLRLAQGSDLIDKGQNVGLPFTGAAPDLGAFEYGPCVEDGGGGSSGVGASSSTSAVASSASVAAATSVVAAATSVSVGGGVTGSGGAGGAGGANGTAGSGAADATTTGSAVDTTEAVSTAEAATTTEAASAASTGDSTVAAGTTATTGTTGANSSGNEVTTGSTSTGVASGSGGATSHSAGTGGQSADDSTLDAPDSTGGCSCRTSGDPRSTGALSMFSLLAIAGALSRRSKRR